MITRNKNLALALLLIIGVYLPVNGQNDTLISPSQDTIIIQPISITDISNTEASYETLKKVKEWMALPDDFKSFDSLYSIAFALLDSSKTQVLVQNYSVDQINDELTKWTKYTSIIISWKDKLKDKLSKLEGFKFRLSVLEKTWEATLVQAKKEKLPADVISNVNKVLADVKESRKELKTTESSLLLIQTKLTDLSLLVDKTISYLSEKRMSLLSEYFAKEKPFIWNSTDSSFSADYSYELFQKSVNVNRNYFEDFFETNSTLLIIMILVFFALWFAFYFLDKYSAKLLKEEFTDILEKAQYVVSKHATSAMVITMFLFLWFFQSSTMIIKDTVQLIALILAFTFLPGFIDKRLKKIFYYLFILFFINEIQSFISGRELINRVILLVESGMTLWVLFIIDKKAGFFREVVKKYNWDFILKLVPVFYLLLFSSIIANIAGFVNLGLILSNAVLNSTFNVLILVLIIVVINRSISVLLRTKYLQASNMVRFHLEIIEKRVHQTVRIMGILLWLRSFFISLGMMATIEEWAIQLIDVSWQVGNITIALSGIIGFILTIVFTVITIRLLKTILSDEIYPRVRLPRGVPGAISMIVGYIVVAFGFYIALGAAGVDLSQFGLIAGALGVGIGFGLQGIVANFIAGIVLAFERPIQVGDTLEIGTMFGDVKHIGVRSTTLRTFEGSEVIIPNSTLITNDVTNWTLSDRKKRRDIKVGVAYGSDPNLVMEILAKVAADHPDVQKIPAPWILFDGFGESSLDFSVRIWTTMDTGLTTKSDVTVAIYNALNEKGIEIPFPKRDVYIKSTPDNKPVTGTKKNSKSK